MNESEFWLAIEQLDWQSDKDPYRFGADLNLYYPDDIELFQSFCIALIDIKKAYQEWVGQWSRWVVPDPATCLTTYADVMNIISDIILSGKKDYYKALNNPRIIYDILESGEYTEEAWNVWL